MNCIRKKKQRIAFRWWLATECCVAAAIRLWWLCLPHIAAGIMQCVSIIGIPVGIANFKIAAIALWPVGRRVVSVEVAQQARIENAR